MMAYVWGLVRTCVLQLVLWTSFKLVQIVVAAFFTVLVWIQTYLAFVGRLFGGEPRALLTVQQARELAADKSKLQAAAATALASAAAAGSNLKQTKLNNAADVRQRRLPDASPQGSIDQDRQGPVDQCVTPSPIHVFPEPQLGHDSLAWQLVGPYMRAYGRHAIANSQLFNPEFIHFFVPGVGSLPYIIVELYNRAAIFGIGEPLASRSHWQHITTLFLQQFPDAYFHHITEEYAELLHDMGYYINSVGSETTLQVQSWTYTGKTRTVRAAARAARESGVRVRELRPEDLTEEMRHKLQHDVSYDWHQQKSIADRHLRVYVRNVDYDTLQLRDGVRVFVAEAFDPAVAPPAVVDPVLQGCALNAKPPRPPRVKRSGTAGICAAPTTMKGLSSSSSSSSSGHGSGSSSSSSSSVASSSIVKGHGSKSGSININATSTTGDAVAWPAPAVLAPVVLHHADATPADAAPQRDQDNTPRAVSQAQAFSGPVPTTGGGSGVGQAAAAAAAAAASGPELVGFVLLDPLWQGGEAVGYVTSMLRMKRSAHTGTLKLLIEDIISNLRKEGRRELAFGFAPLFNVCDGRIFKRYIHWMYWTCLYLYHFCNNVYAFKNLAYAKSRYGAGLGPDKMSFNDPNVKLTHVLYAMPSYLPGWNILDFYALFTYIGIIDSPWSVYLKLVGIRKGGENLK